METLFPHLTSTGSAPSYHQVLAKYRAVFLQQVRNGSLRPLVLPYHLYGCLALLAYLCIPHTKRPLVYATRWPVLAGILVWQWKTAREASSMSMATGFAAGLVAAWGAVLGVVWLVLYRPQFEAMRVDRKKKLGTREENVGAERLEGNGSSTGYKEGNGFTELKYRRWGVKPEGFTRGKPAKSNAGSEMEYYWQSYPDTLWDRFTWTSDLLINFRGPGWNWAIPVLPPLPPFIATQLGETISASSRSGISSIGLRRYDTRAQLFRARMPLCVAGYFLLDILKLTMMKDPYYTFGPTTYAVPSHLSGYSPRALQFIRQALSTVAILVSLEMVFLLPPLFLSLLCGPSLFGLRAEPWYYPTTWGSWSNITNKGLNGLWGGWWHQTFRLAFSAPSNFLINNGYVKAGSPIAKFLALFFAFGISGFLHSAGSLSQFPQTHLSHALIFFMLQALGIVFQLTLCSTLHPIIKTLPRSVRQVGNFLFVFMWLFYTGWWLTDDFARGGIWLYEPIPISPLRGLGFGIEGDGWWCWQHIGVGWYTGKHWWESGIAI